MKVNEVPQDNDFFQPDSSILLRDRNFALDENGKFREVPSVGWKPKNDAIKFAWKNRMEEAEEMRRQVTAGKSSPLAYHMVRMLMTPPILAGYTGISRRKIKKFCKPKHFATIKTGELSRLADALSISVEELTSID
ncbi:MAG: helix-turn-helix transcriptional regulator [Bacteroidales bacterium]|jgi:hypothetical protein|nr:helix-turn-helix transcriptional regulator [Bacteroidales bacterium]MDD2264953.1 helix-turn-helix transcriptional regulator [Bacteroidales bacterium]MDD2832121.1 helix-turn-helix transcriptional regulator [Bacteroidales bacterium]MDD3208773.1 helix-turn-helix transcriptional regulator [Bacteroidales bacterium]MDD3697336.1 helix-turn-helix transcriptional regulator [Bacteroidales bacterium]